MVVRVQPETCEYFENEIPGAGRHENGFYLYVRLRIPWRASDSIPRLYFVGTLAWIGRAAQRPKTLLDDSPQLFLIAKEKMKKILNRKIRSRLPAVEIRKSIVCSTIGMTIREKTKSLGSGDGGGGGLRTMPYFISFHYLCTNFIYSGSFIFERNLYLLLRCD